jgi:hypothetical protein
MIGFSTVLGMYVLIALDVEEMLIENLVGSFCLQGRPFFLLAQVLLFWLIW